MPDDRKPITNHLLKYVWNLPNEVIGKGLGYAGHGIGMAAHAAGLQKAAPRSEYDPVRGMTNFINSPLSPMGALTVGHNTMYDADPDTDLGWIETQRANGQSVRDHEAKHAEQGDLLGPFYLPSNILGGLNAKLRGQDWKDGPNWNEVGPYMNPPRAWPPRRR